eukprot:CAMPEP_0113581366 /NCGR_PEP_ID=MMETSP0015_2-20120614/31246_1 /TAXON_ID=2838 /ORGANISM="Odontella" /LENGTH=35 /DNA_ID=CAMNT_0000485773 /DNA_START=89 /DNA_END=192 /DNA_ORIENTATION=- /assembly_acc=CAM_ASM_000160
MREDPLVIYFSSLSGDCYCSSSQSAGLLRPPNTRR